jgi:hypothetical protein
MRRPFPLHLLLLAALLLAPPAFADISPDLAFTAFANADINSMTNGQVLQARGGLIDFQRGITSQSVYILDAAPADVQKKLVTWDPAAHPELQVWMHKAIPFRPALGDFSALASLPDNSSVKTLVTATENLDPNNPALQVNSGEAQMIAAARTPGIDPNTLLQNAWSQVLLGRINRFMSGNFTTDHYAVAGGDIYPLAEIKSLLRSDPKIYQRYHPLLVHTPVYNSNKLKPVTLYYESFDVEGAAALGTGAVYQTRLDGAYAGESMAPAPTPALAPDAAAPVDASTMTAPLAAPTGRGPVLSADIEYYLNSGIYVSLELEQVSPVNVNGRIETLVWRDDLASTSNVAYLHGTERLASGMIMLQDVKQAIDAFRSEFRQ